MNKSYQEVTAREKIVSQNYGSAVALTLIAGFFLIAFLGMFGLILDIALGVLLFKSARKNILKIDSEVNSK